MASTCTPTHRKNRAQRFVKDSSKTDKKDKILTEVDPHLGNFSLRTNPVLPHSGITKYMEVPPRLKIKRLCFALA